MRRRDRLDADDDDRLRAPPQPVAPDRGRRDIRQPPAPGATGDPSVLREDAAHEPRRPGAPRRADPGAPTAVGRRNAGRASRRRGPPRPPAARRPLRGPCSRLPLDPAGAVVRDVARLGRPGRSPDRSRPRTSIGLGRGDSPGAPDRGGRSDRRTSPRRLLGVAGQRRSPGIERSTDRGRARVAARSRRRGGAAGNRRSAGERVRDRARPWERPHHCGCSAGSPRGAASRPADRDDLRIRAPCERRRLDPPRRRLPGCLLGRERRPGLASGRASHRSGRGPRRSTDDPHPPARRRAGRRQSEGKRARSVRSPFRCRTSDRLGRRILRGTLAEA